MLLLPWVLAAARPPDSHTSHSPYSHVIVLGQYDLSSNMESIQMKSVVGVSRADAATGLGWGCSSATQLCPEGGDEALQFFSSGHHKPQLEPLQPQQGHCPAEALPMCPLSTWLCSEITAALRVGDVTCNGHQPGHEVASTCWSHQHQLLQERKHGARRAQHEQARLGL